MTIETQQHWHFIGIGGCGMAALADIALDQNFIVTGSDSTDSETIQRLKHRGATITLGHQKKLPDSPLACINKVIYSTAIRTDNIELNAAQKSRLVCQHRSQALAELMCTKYSIAIAGSHGKTTTSVLLQAMLSDQPINFAIGGKCLSTHRNGQWQAHSKLFLVEADESDGSLINLKPDILVLHNLQPDHLEHHNHNFDVLKHKINNWINDLPADSLIFINKDDLNCAQLLMHIKHQYMTYSCTDPSAHYYLQRNASLPQQVCITATSTSKVQLIQPIPGAHNASNLLAAFAVAEHLKRPVPQIKNGLSQFKGIDRRWHVQNAVQFNGKTITVLDDYAHHPDELDALFRSVQEHWPNRRILTVFQPHRYSRTQHCLPGFVKVLSQCEKLWLLPVYAASETPKQGYDSNRLWQELHKKNSKNTVLLSSLSELNAHLSHCIHNHDIVLFIGAGDLYRFARNLSKKTLLNPGLNGKDEKKSGFLLPTTLA